MGEADGARGDEMCARTRAAPGAIKGNLIHPVGSAHSCCRSELHGAQTGGLTGKHAVGSWRNQLHKSNISFKLYSPCLLSNVFLVTPTPSHEGFRNEAHFKD